MKTGASAAVPFAEVDLSVAWSELAECVFDEVAPGDRLDAFGGRGGKYPELSARSQAILVSGYQAGLRARQALSEGAVSGIQAAVAERMVVQGEQCSEYLLGSVFRLVRSKVWERARKRFGDAWATELLPELLADATATALEAASTFDTNRGPTFASWVAERVDQDMAGHMGKHGRMGSTPQAWGRLIRIIHHAKPELEERLGRSASISELRVVLEERCRVWSEEHLGADQQGLVGAERERAINEKMRKQGMSKALTELPQILAAMQPEAALEASYEDSDVTLGDRTAGYVDVEAEVCSGDSAAEYVQTLDVGTGNLTGTEKDMVLTYLGLGDEEGGTYRKVALQFGVPDLRVRHLVRDAQARLRAPHAQYSHLGLDIDAQFDAPGGDDAPVKSALRRRGRRTPLVSSEALLAEALA